MEMYSEHNEWKALDSGQKSGGSDPARNSIENPAYKTKSKWRVLGIRGIQNESLGEGRDLCFWDFLVVEESQNGLRIVSPNAIS